MEIIFEFKIVLRASFASLGFFLTLFFLFTFPRIIVKYGLLLLLAGVGKFSLVLTTEFLWLIKLSSSNSDLESSVKMVELSDDDIYEKIATIKFVFFRKK